MNGQWSSSFNLSNLSARRLFTKAIASSRPPVGALPSSQVTRLSPPRYLKTLVVSLLAITGYTGGYLVAQPSQMVASSGLNATNDQATNDQGSVDRALPVQVFEISPVRGYSVQRQYTGEVQAARTSNLGFELSGALVSLEVQSGEAVVAGQAIARLDVQNLEAQRELLLAQKAQAQAILQELQNGPRREAIAMAQSNVKELEDQWTLQKTRQMRREQLYAEGVIARETLDEVFFGTEALRDRLAAAQSQLQELQTGTRPEQLAAQQAAIAQINAQIADLDITLDKSILRAPYSGIIGERLVDEGTVVNAGQAIVRLVEGASPEVEVGIPEEVASSLVMGSWAAVDIAGQTYQAELIALKPEIDVATRTRPLVLQLEAGALRQVVPQQIARLTLEQTVPTQGYWLPVTALLKGDRGLWSAYVVIPLAPAAVDSIFGSGAGAKVGSKPGAPGVGLVERRDIEVLYVEGERALVRGTLEAGDRIIESGVQRIVPGQKVTLP